MERIIKFRAWDEQNAEMRYPKLAEENFGHGGADSCDILKYYSVVMQFSGICDKNKKEIYEGDIVTLWLDFYGSKDEYTGTVIFKDGSFFIDDIKDNKYKEPKCAYRPHNSMLLSQYELYEALSKTYVSNYGEVFTFSENATYVEIIGNIHQHPELLTT